MNLLNTHICNYVFQDFLHKYQIKNTKILPKIEKVSLSAKFTGHHKESIVTFFEILTFHKPYVCQSRSNILSLNLRKGEPVGIKLHLRKKPIYDFLNYFLFELLPSSKKFKGLKMSSNSIHWQIKDIFAYEETSYLYIYLQDLRTLDIVIEGKNLNPNFFLACRFPLIKKELQNKSDYNLDE